MVIVLLEAENNMINPVVPTLTKNINPSCVKILYKKINVEQLNEYKKPPLLETGWFLVYSGVDKRVMQYLVKLDFNITILCAHSRSSGELISEFLTGLGIEFRIIDNLNISKQTKIEYIKRELLLNESDATYLYNRTRGYLKDLTSAVFALKGLTDITRKDIKSLVPKTEKFGLNDLYNYLIGDKSTDMKYENAVKLVHKYRYGFDFLKEFLLEKLQQTMRVFEKVSTGELSIENYREYSDKSLTALSQFQLYKIIEQYRDISYDYLYFLFVNVSSLTSNGIGLLMLLNLLKLRKETVNV